MCVRVCVLGKIATLPAFLSACGISPPPLRSLLHFHAGLRLAVDVNVNVEAAGCE